MRKKLEAAESDRERCQEELSAAEMRIDRLQSSTVSAVQTPPPPKDSAMEDVQPGSGSPHNHSGSPPVSKCHGN
jgi:E3 ubiquitin-protein ligase BRE1